jgi:MraZ protein
VEFELLTGTFESTLDDKGRVVIPAILREHYSGKLFIFRGLKEKCVWVMTPENYYKKLRDFEAKSQNDTFTDEEIEAFTYQFITTRHNVEIDPKTGRILIPGNLKNYADLKKECLVVSVIDHLEIWNTELNNAFMEEVRLINKNIHKKMTGRANFLPKEGE